MRSFVVVLGILASFVTIVPGKAVAMETVSQSYLMSYYGVPAYDARRVRSFERHFRDNNRFYPNPEDLKGISVAPPSRSIGGQTTYFRFVNMGYRYNAVNQKGRLIIYVRIHIQGYTKAMLTRTGHVARLASAEAIWNTNAPRDLVGFPYSFKFSFVDSAAKSDYSVKFVDNTRGPYSVSWNPKWAGPNMAHEIGHMMGLADEYDEYGQSLDHCHTSALMCSHWGVPQKYYYYHVMRKVFAP